MWGWCHNVIFNFTGYYLLYSVHLNFASDSVSYLVKYIITLIWKYMPSGVIKDTAYLEVYAVNRRPQKTKFYKRGP